MKKSTSILVFTILAACASTGSALQCYECSHLDRATAASCNDPFGGKAPIRTCNTGEVCTKQTTPEMTIGNDVISPLVSRGCVRQSFCSELPAKFQSQCHTCTSNNCNSGITIIPSLSTVIVLFIVTFTFLKL